MKRALLALLLLPSVAQAQPFEPFNAYVSGLPSATTPQPTDQLYLLQSGVSKKATLSTLLGATGAITSLTGPITATGPGAAATTIAAGVVTGNNLVNGTITSTQIASGTVANSNLAAMTQNAVKGAATSTAPTDLAVPSCSTASSVLQWTTNTGFGCATISGLPAGTQGQALLVGPSSTPTFYSECLNILSFGGSGNGSTDNSTALTNAIAALSTNGGCIFFPSGKFAFTSAFSTSMANGIYALDLVGAGRDNTILTWPNASGGMTINYTNAANSVHVRDLSFTTQQVGSGTGLTLNSVSVTPQPISDVYRVTFRGDDGYNVTDRWTTGLAIANVSNVNVDGIMAIGAGTNGTGVNIIGLPGSSKFATQINIAKGVFQSLGIGVNYQSFVQGVTIDQTNFTGVTTGVNVPSSQTGTLAQLSITNSQFGISGAGNGIITSTPIVGLQISNNYFICNAANCTAIAMPASSWFNITGNYISSASNSGTTGILDSGMTTGTGGSIVGNTIFGFNVGIGLTSGVVAGAKIGAQFNVTSIGNTTAISNACAGTCTTTTNY